MTDESRRILTDAGIQVDDLLERLLDSEELMFRLLRAFPDDPNYADLVTGLALGDRDLAFRSCHTLKGVAGNLSMERFYPLICKQTEFLRHGHLGEAMAMMPEVDAQYAALCAAIRSLD